MAHINSYGSFLNRENYLLYGKKDNKAVEQIDKATNSNPIGDDGRLTDEAIAAQKREQAARKKAAAAK